MLWTHRREALDAFVAGLNSLRPRIRFTAETSMDSLTFLDVRVYKGPRFESDNILDPEIHYKPTNHFKAAFTRLPFSQKRMLFSPI